MCIRDRGYALRKPPIGLDKAVAHDVHGRGLLIQQTHGLVWGKPYPKEVTANQLACTRAEVLGGEIAMMTLIDPFA